MNGHWHSCPLYIAGSDWAGLSQTVDINQSQPGAITYSGYVMTDSQATWALDSRNNVRIQLTTVDTSGNTVTVSTNMPAQKVLDAYKSRLWIEPG
jgi:hypothetical protein